MIHLKKVREEKQISQERLAKLSGISRQTISKIEADPDSNVTIDTVTKLATALAVKIEDIFSG